MMSFECSSEAAWASAVLLWFIYLFNQECFAPSVFNNITAKSELQLKWEKLNMSNGNILISVKSKTYL